MRTTVRTGLIIIIIANVVLLALAPYDACGAAAETRYELTTGGLTFGNDVIITGLNQSVFHQSSAAAGDSEAFALSFPGALDFSPSRGTNIALPSIHQAGRQAVSTSSTGFFQANLPYYPCCNFGAAPVGVGQFGKPSPVKPARFRGNALLYPEMINKGILTPELKYENKNINNTMVTLPPLLSPGPYVEAAVVANSTVGETPVNNSSLGNVTPLLLSTHRFNLDSNASQINNYSIVERMWRNSHLAHLMDIAYEGESSRPIWMAPLKPAETLQRTNHSKVLGHALNMTKPGKYLTGVLWDLAPMTPGKL